MFELPAYPDVYTTRHITCISCKEKFALTEGHQDKNPDDNRWRVLSNEASRISLRQEDNRQQRPVAPQPLQIPADLEHQSDFLQQAPVSFTPYAVHCPRCGADNRNWLTLQNHGGKGSWKTYRERFPHVLYALSLAGVFSLFTLFIPLPWLQVIVLAVFIPLAVWALASELIPSWKKLRENQHILKVKRDAPDFERSLWIRGFIWVFLASILLPLIFFSIAPRTVIFALEFIRPDTEAELDEAATAVTEAVNFEFDQTAENLEALTNDMDDLLADMPAETPPPIEEEINAFSQTFSNIVTVALKELNIVRQENPDIINARRTEELNKINDASTSIIAQITDEIMGDFRFLVIWAVMMGLPTFISVFIIMRGVKAFVNRVDQQLPPPIFSTVAGMTRIVSWEAKQALEIEGTMHHIQWVNVLRNDKGGIDLIGLHRAQPTFDAYGRAQGETVRAQKHLISTDMWGRIIDATIQDTRVPRPAESPEYVATFQIPHDAPMIFRQPAR